VTLVRTNRTPPSNVNDTGPPRDASLLKRAEWHGGCYRKRGRNPGIGGQEIMAVDYVLLHIIIALGVMALAAHTANSR
jgi:hypothetical protein